MSSIDHNELFEQYYQTEYDFNTASLTSDELMEIKKLVREKRVDYALAPMGTAIFNWILKQNNNIRFELVSFDSEKIDGMLYIPTTGKERAYIILNSNKPLANQIYTAAHEFYHYVKDYQKFKKNPYICDFSMLKDVNEKKACRFAAELLLPEEALSYEVRDFCLAMDISDVKTANFNHFATLIIFLTVKYQMPLKAVIYRLQEERYIENIDNYIDNYEFIKKVLQEIRIFGKRVDELYSTENSYVIPYSSTYQDMEKAFSTGNASKKDILEDAAKLNLDMRLIDEFLSEDAEEDDAEDDDELFSIINKKRG
jgi:Zn-dependent peptidase ImmA (M78 family)